METPPNRHQLSASPRSDSDSSRALSKRSRVVVSQSKGGCMTCKKRRVKCDELRPLCRRCVQAGRLCGGYSHDNESSLALQPALRTGVAVDSQTERLSYLAAHVLSLDSNGRPLQEDGLWGRTYLQLSDQVECVKAAAAAFGAAYEASLDNDNAVAKSAFSPWHYYGSALARLREDFENKTAGPESLTLASMILACVEILSQHEENAFAHFCGAVQTLNESFERLEGASPADTLQTMKDELVKADVMIGSYAMSQTPIWMHVESQSAAAGIDAFRDPGSAINAALLCLHRTYRFINSVARARYTYPSWRDHDASMCKAQSEAADQCRSVLDGLLPLTTSLQAQHSSAPSSLRESETLAEIYALRTQLTAALVFILCIHSPFQTAYDDHLDGFQSIVSDAAASARLRRRTRPSAFNRFSTRPGIVSSLFFVSMRCRDLPLRTLATRMLGEQGREGPTDGQIQSAIGARIVALETTASGWTPCSGAALAALAACDVAEGRRLHGYGLQPIRKDDEGRRVIDVTFSRPDPPLLQGWGLVDYASPDLSKWVIWKETIEIG